MYHGDIYPIDSATNSQVLAIEQAIEETLGRTWDETEEAANTMACIYRIYCPTEIEALQVAGFHRVDT